jgi:RND family efflux transporter MFP subunit
MFMTMRSLLKFSVVLAGCFLAACGDKKPDAPNPAAMPVPVNIYTVQAGKAVYVDKFPGSVVAMMQVDIRPEVEGYVTGIFFKEGTHVRKGQKLYSIDDRKYAASYNQAYANVKVAESNLDQAQKDADRYNYLNQHEAVAKQILDHAMTTLQNARQQVAAAKQEMEKTRTDLNYSVITAPFDGTIGISQVKLGNTVTTGQTVLNTISTDDPMAVDFVVNERQIPRFTRLQQKNIAAADSVFTLQMPDNSIYSQPGKIAVIDRGVNPQTGTIIVRLSFPNASMSLRPGMSCNVLVKNDDTAQQLLIPYRAVVPQMGEYFVYIAKDTLIPVVANGSKGGKDAPPETVSLHALQRKVALGPTTADKVVIISGLQSGDVVVVDGVQKLSNGRKIVAGGAGSKAASH